MSSSSKSCQHSNRNGNTETEKCLITLNEIFDNGDTTTAAADRFSDREELPNERVTVHLRSAGLLINSFRLELAADGLDLFVDNGLLRVEGYAPTNNYNVRREVQSKMAKCLTPSRSFP